MPRLFTLQEAEELLPSVERWLQAAMESKTQAGRLEGELTGVLTRIQQLGGVQIDVRRVAEAKSARERFLERLRQSLGEIENSGCLVKDLETGLVDFPTLLDGDEVCLCWKLGEANIGYWHHTSEGFAGRKSIDPEFLQRHKGGRPH